MVISNMDKASANIVSVFLKVRRFDIADQPSKGDLVQFYLDSTLDYNTLKRELMSWFKLNENDDKVIKLRNKELILVPFTSLLGGNTPESYFIVDITQVQHAIKSTANLQDAYLDAVRQKIQSMESRISQCESLIPQTQLRRQEHMEHTVQNMSNIITFLDRRIDDLMPSEWKSKMPVTIS